MESNIYYYGTSLESAGHDFWNCNVDFIGKEYGFRYSEFSKSFFCPETMADGKNLKNGDVIYDRIGKYTIIYIEGSCSDTRGSSKSVFFTDEKIRFGDFAVKIMETPICNKIIKKCPFEINWKLRTDLIEKIKCL